MTHASVRRPFRFCWWCAALAVLLLDLPGAAAQTAGLPAAFAACQEDADAPAVPALPVAGPLPGGVSGRVAFQATLYDRTGAPLREVTLGDVNRVMPLASAFKTTVVAGALRDVDAGRLRLTQLFTTTAENRSIEGFAPGQNTLRNLLERSIRNSDNTASDIVQLAVGPERLAALVKSWSSCTEVQLTTKAMWAAMAGLTPVVQGRTRAEVRASALAYATLPPAGKARAAQVLNAHARTLTGPFVEEQLDVYFKGALYHPDTDVFLQPVSTARAYTDLLARLLRGSGTLSGSSQALLRATLSTGCCTRPGVPLRVRPSYWGAKAGSGWGLLTLSGYLELPGGQNVAYTYLNHESRTLDSEVIEGQIRPVLNWIVGNVNALTAGLGTSAGQTVPYPAGHDEP